MPVEVVILGGGVGGTLTANLLDRKLGRDVHITVVDPTGMHMYQPGFLYAALGRANGRWLSRDERLLLREDVDLAIDSARNIDPHLRSVGLGHGGSLPYDYLVLATGAQLVPERIPGMTQGAHHFYSLDGALGLREALRTFRGGRIVLGIAGVPYKCPPAPVEFALLLEGYLRRTGIRERAQMRFLSPINRALTIEPASRMVEPILAQRGIELGTFFNVESVDPSAHMVTSLEGEKEEYDLLVLVPPHAGQDVIAASNLGGSGGWVPTDRYTLQHTAFKEIFAIGDATDLPISKSGSTAHFEAPVIASRIASLVDGSAPKVSYGGRVMCFLETGNGKASAMRFDYEHPPVPPQPSRAWHLAKWLFDRLYWNTVPKARIPNFRKRGSSS